MRRLPAPLLLLFGLLLARPAAAGGEEFSTFDVIRQEEDDESLLDHLLMRPPRAWRDEWEHAPQALRTSQGCLTSGQWSVDTRLKLRSPLGEHASFGLDVRDDQSDRAAYTYFDLSFRFPTPIGAPGFMFRPLFDKSRQDLALFWETGADTTALQTRWTFTLEDVFNNLWAFRQSRVGEVSEPYDRHPFEPAIRIALRQPRWRMDLEGQVLTPSRKDLVPVFGQPAVKATLWGTWARAGVECRALGLEWQAAGENRQAHSSQTLSSTTELAGGSFRRQWSGEVGVSGRAARLELEGRWLYQGRSQGSDTPYPIRRLDAVDRVIQLEARWSLWSRSALRFGGLHDRVTAGSSGAWFPTYGTRVESRGYVGFDARFGRVWLSAVEGIELDPERYEVWWVHDKGFFQLQTTF